MTQQYSLSEVAKHNTEQSCWIVINNDVFDVTEWLKEHPGGDQILLENCAKDASVRYSEIGHSNEAKQLKFKYKIGELIESEKRPLRELDQLEFTSSSADDAEKEMVEMSRNPPKIEDTPMLEFLWKTNAIQVAIVLVGFYIYMTYF